MATSLLAFDYALELEAANSSTWGHRTDCVKER